ncbi:uncharacterized protein A4U43_C01F10160 [Asparagus officinalis]|uniref:Leucine-rich repeat-containing N-terminal plant-type domain-containing protein n=1 Tax=Asparagus officinalis TaxID=4686 RepID=A0A5P1FNA2_ASPOF|nr:uncharacterized protein A4U43_C01F10160 [Asparagus officinalis]
MLEEDGGEFLVERSASCGLPERGFFRSSAEREQLKVKIKNCVNGTEGNSVVGLSARFGSSLPSHASKALKTSAVLANPFNCSSPSSRRQRRRCSSPPLSKIRNRLLVPAANGDDARALLSLKSEIDPSNSLQWDSMSSSGFCSWPGVKECNGDGRVTKLVVERSNLTGTLRSETLAPMDQIRVLSFKSNSLSGPVPDLSPLLNLKSLYLNSNRFSGKIPSSVSSLHRLKIVVLSDNLLTGEIPPSFAQIQRLYTLYLENNRLTGQIPSFRQRSLKFLNFSNNNLSGEIPGTKTLAQFNLSSFLNIPNLCGAQVQNPCAPGDQSPTFPPPRSISSPLNLSPHGNPPTRHKNKKKLVKIWRARSRHSQRWPS